MNITSAKYRIFNDQKNIKATINGIETIVPMSEGNRHYDEIKRQVDPGTLIIESAD